MLIVKNSSEVDLFVENVSLLDGTGSYANQIYPNVFRSGSEVVAQSAGSMATNVGVGAAATVAGAFIPFAGLLAGPAMMGTSYGTMYGGAKDQENLLAEVKRRRLELPVALSRDGFKKGSVFFPLSVPGRSLIVQYRVGKNTDKVMINIP